MPIHLPRDTRAVLGPGATGCDSVALLQQKFPFIDPSDDPIKPHRRIALAQFLTDGPTDLDNLRAEAHRAARPNPRRPNPRREAEARELLAVLAPFDRQTPACAALLDPAWLQTLPAERRRALTLETASRLIVGHANGVVENAGLTLHRTHGVPIIPGAAVKNVARRAALDYAYDAGLLADLFGSAGQKARVAWLTAIPSAGPPPALAPDIATPHYSNYYSGDRAHAHAPDTESPNPVEFPAVAAGARFDFTVFLIRPTGDATRDDALLDEAKNLLHDGLTRLGLGAKTSAGHGYFLPDLANYGPLARGHEVDFVLLTPAIAAGARRDQPEVRVASIRGQLRQVYRMLGATPADEHALFGGIGNNLPAAHPKHKKPMASAIALRLERLNPGADAPVPFCPHNQGHGWRPAVASKTRFKLRWRDRFAAADQAGAKARATAFRRVLDAWLLLGAVGCRSTRAAGSVWRLQPGSPANPIAPTPDEFMQALAKLSLPATLKVAVLDRLPPTGGKEETDFLRGVATDTINRLGPDLFLGDPLGYAQGRNRKASPLKLKVGRFHDGYRLIAVWDNRNNRGGDLKAAIAALNTACKDIGKLLAKSPLAGLPPRFP